MKYLKSFDQLNESLNENIVDSYVKKFQDKMDGSTPSTAAGWMDGIGGLSDDDKRSIWMGIQDAIDHESQGSVELPDWVSGSSRGRTYEQEEEDPIEETDPELQRLLDRGNDLTSQINKARTEKRNASFLKSQLNKIFRQIDSYRIKKEKSGYDYSKIKQIFKENELPAAKSSSTAVRGYRRYSKGYEVLSYDPSVIQFHKLGSEEFKRILKDLEDAGVNIEDSQEPSNVPGGGSVAHIKLGKK